jgi:hypothetical protein
VIGERVTRPPRHDRRRSLTTTIKLDVSHFWAKRY